ncbi:MAG: histidine ammonia-lyase [Eubacteriales bacterium]|nr:histidine ammonia-lyase [Eubacteriales bacterium]
MGSILALNGHDLTIEDIVAVSRFGKKVAISPASQEKILASEAIVAEIVASHAPVYGVSTGYGEFSTVRISEAENMVLQRNLIVSHACGVGEPFKEDEVRAIMLLRLNTLCSGYSGVSHEVPDILVEMLNQNIIPYIPKKGSLGASGDLANLAHMALTMLGEGEVLEEGKRRPSAEVLQEKGLKPVTLKGKDGLAIINGTPVMTGLGVLALYDAEKLLRAANQGAALSFEALMGITAALDPRVHMVRPHPGQIATAAYLLKMLEGSSSVNQREGDVQDAYTLRCVPQVHGAVTDALSQIRQVLEIEINSVTDNPLVFPDNHDVISGGNFHGEPLALQLDFLAIAVAELADMAERRIERLVNPQLNYGLPAFLVEAGGVNSGFMIPQYTAASLVSENKILAHPASVDSIPSSANKEDHVSMGANAARKVGEIIMNVRDVLAIEWLVAAQACDLRKVERLGQGTEQLYQEIRKQVKFYDRDRVMYPDMHILSDLIKEASVLDRVEAQLAD